jgi:hypothetical protein
MSHLYLNRANIVFEDKRNNEIVGYFFEEKITLVIRPEEIAESYIYFCAYDKSDLIQDALDYFKNGVADVIQGDIEEVKEMAQQ